jgi:hypothetical protein
MRLVLVLAGCLATWALSLGAVTSCGENRVVTCDAGNRPSAVQAGNSGASAPTDPDNDGDRCQ